MRRTKGSSINKSAGTFRIRCTWLSFFVITIGPEYKQDTLSHHFIQRSCKYFGGRHQLYLDRKQFVTTTTSDSFLPPKPKWISSGRPGTPGPLTLAETPSHVWPKCNHVQTNRYSLCLTMNSYIRCTFGNVNTKNLCWWATEHRSDVQVSPIGWLRDTWFNNTFTIAAKTNKSSDEI